MTRHDRPSVWTSVCVFGLVTLMLSGCGVTLPTTGSLFGGDDKPAVAPTITNSATNRALQVGSTAARAQKCGFNFDAAKLRTQYLLSESTLNPNAAEVDKAGRIYDTAYRGISKAVATKGEDYCSESKTGKIRSALNRHLAGDYTPDVPEPAAKEEGLFSGFDSSDGGEGMKLKHPMDNN